MPGGLYSSCTHLARWNEKATGGRWYECTVAKMSDGKSFYCACGDGDEGRKTDVVAKNVSPQQGDAVISYAWNTSYAFKGRINGSRPGEWYIIFDDGDEKWSPHHKVFKYTLC